MTINHDYDALLERVICTIDGARPSHAMGAMFSAFVGICMHYNVDAGRQFEDLLSQYEGRVKATHRGSVVVH